LETAEALTRIGSYAAARTRTAVFSNACIESNALTMAFVLARAGPRSARTAKKSAQDARPSPGEDAGNAYCFFRRNDRKVSGLPDFNQSPLPTSLMCANSNAWLEFLRFA
jgi:hypothetical protein